MESNKFIFIIVLLSSAVILLSACLWQEKNQNKALVERNEHLADLLHYEQYDELELVPCSICGEEVYISRVSDRYYIRCPKCGYESEAYKRIQDAIDRWNSINNSRQN